MRSSQFATHNAQAGRPSQYMSSMIHVFSTSPRAPASYVFTSEPSTKSGGRADMRSLRFNKFKTFIRCWVHFVITSSIVASYNAVNKSNLNTKCANVSSARRSVKYLLTSYKLPFDNFLYGAWIEP
jgi:hypothetical protein